MEVNWRRVESVKHRLSVILPVIQLGLVIAGLLTDLSRNKGRGEGTNQVIANLLTNVEFYMKQALGYGDIVKYDFRWSTTLAGILFWFLFGYVLSVVTGIWKKRQSQLG